ncbi:transglycosylase domain-containing protein [Microbaculum marinum]
MLEADSFIDAFFYSLLDGVKRGLEGYSARLERFNVKGWRRVLVELFSDGLTMGAGGAVLMLALAIPAFDETHDDWRGQAQYSVVFLDRYGNEIGKRGILHNDSVPLDEIPDHMIKATLATEDRRFYEHFGIDVMGTFRALIENMRHKTVVQGGSSLTQQLAKNLFLTNERTIERKIKEAFLALWLETHLTKNEILKLYLDRAYLGGGTFGVDAAAEFYFGKSVRDINLAEAAMIAGLFKAPGRYAPHIDLPAARGRANTVLQNMVEAGFMTEGQVFAARRSPATPVDRSGHTAPDYFLDWAFEEVRRITGGKAFVLTAKTTVDMTLQQVAEEAVESNLRQYGKQYGASQAAMAMADLDGAVRAMVGGRDYGESQFNRATSALRQPGSSFKPYVYMTALANGYSPQSIVADAPITIGGWSPQNYGRRFRGNITLTTALQYSVNTVAVRLAQAVGRDKIVETAKNMGVNTPLVISKSLPLGASEVTVMDQLAGFGTLASGGLKMTPYGIVDIRDGEGNVIYRHSTDEPPRPMAVPPEKVAELNAMLYQAANNGTGRRALFPTAPIAGKTGTTNAYRDGWFCGFTGNYVAAIWVGNDDFTSTRRMTGGSLPAMTWNKLMSYAHNGIEIKPIPGVGGVPDEPVLVADAEAAARAAGEGATVPAESLILSKQSENLLYEIERLMRQAPALQPAVSQGPSAMLRARESGMDAWQSVPAPASEMPAPADVSAAVQEPEPEEVIEITIRGNKS